MLRFTHMIHSSICLDMPTMKRPVSGGAEIHMAVKRIFLLYQKFGVRCAV